MKRVLAASEGNRWSWPAERLPVLLAVTVLLLCVLIQVGCGAATSGDRPRPSSTSVLQALSSSVPQESSSEAPEATVQTGGTTDGRNDPQDVASAWPRPAEEITRAFEQVQAQVTIPVFAPSRLPAGTALATSYVSALFTEAGGTSGVANPSIAGSAGQPEVRVLLQVNGAPLEVIEGIRGDLGDLPATPIDNVAGVRAKLYEVMGGHLVQWSSAGVWYGVFARDLDEDTVIAVARYMERVSASLGG